MLARAVCAVQTPALHAHLIHARRHYSGAWSEPDQAEHVPFHPCAGRDRCGAGRPDQRRLDVDAEHPVARSSAARARAGASDPALARVRAAGGRRAAAGRPVPAQASATRLAGGDRADGAVGPARPAQGARLRGDRDHVGSRARAVGGRSGLPRRARSADAAVGVLARAAARYGRADGQRPSPAWASEGHPSWSSGPRDGRPAAVAQRAAPLRPPRPVPSPFCLGAARRASGRARDAAGDGLRHLPAAGHPGVAPRSRLAAQPPPSSSAPTAPTRCRSSSCGPTSTTSSATIGERSSATGSRTASCCCPAIRSVPRTPSPSCCRSCARSPRSGD